MLKMGENKRLQTELQNLCAQEAKYLKTFQPWHEEVSQIALQAIKKPQELSMRRAAIIYRVLKTTLLQRRAGTYQRRSGSAPEQ